MEDWSIRQTHHNHKFVWEAYNRRTGEVHQCNSTKEASAYIRSVLHAPKKTSANTLEDGPWAGMPKVPCPEDFYGVSAGWLP